MALNLPTLPSSMISMPRAKVTHADRAAIYALRKILHVSPQVLSEIFGISCVTVHKITSHKTKAYKDVIAMVNDIGVETMYARYVTQDMLDKISAMSQVGLPIRPQALLDADNAALRAPNPVARSHQGVYALPLRISGEFHTIDIQWKEETDSGNRTKARGWHVAHPRAGWAGWFGDADNKPFATSKAAHAFAQTESLTLYMPDPT